MVLTLNYRKDLFRDAGLDPARAPQTWEELLAYAEKLTDPLKGRYGLALYPAWQALNFFWQGGSEVLAEDQNGHWRAVFNDDNAVNTLRFLRKLFSHKKTVPDPKCPTLLCCGKPMTAKECPGVTAELDAKKAVNARYDAFAERGGGAACCAGETAASPGFAAGHGLYSQEELSQVPEIAFTLSRGCGNPVGFSDLHPGEVVVDLGCGAGIDVVLAALKVGPSGKVVGVDVAPHMIERAQQGVAEAGLTATVEFVVTDLEGLKLPDGVADVVISNCVINLCPDKEAVYREAFRILKPGGRLSISDIVYAGTIDPEVRERFRSTWSGCVGGAIQEDRYLQIIRDAGFTDVIIIARHPLQREELGEMACCPGPEFSPVLAKEDSASADGKVVSIKFRASKPAEL